MTLCHENHGPAGPGHIFRLKLIQSFVSSLIISHTYGYIEYVSIFTC